MTNQEFSDQFDILYNSITSNLAPGLDEYEKSVFLTKALNELILDYFNAKKTKTLDGFDSNERRLIDFSSLMASKTILSTAMANPIIDTHSNSKSISIENADKVLLIINELVIVTRGTTTNVVLLAVPISYLEYFRVMSKPFKRPLKWLAWRLISKGASNKITLVGALQVTTKLSFDADLIVAPQDTITKYIIRYIKRPNPIIIANLDGLSIDDISTETECQLNPIMHPDILQRAVELAKVAYMGDINSQLAVGMLSATDAGILTRQ